MNSSLFLTVGAVMGGTTCSVPSYDGDDAINVVIDGSDGFTVANSSIRQTLGAKGCLLRLD